MVGDTREDSKGVVSQGPHTAFITKIHHSITDGISWRNVIRSQLFFSPNKNAELPRVYDHKQQNGFKTFMENASLPMKVVYSAAKQLSATRFPSPFLVPDEKQTAKAIYNTTDRMPLKMLKEIKNHFRVSMSSVIFAATALALREILIKKVGIKNVPSTQTLLTAYPSKEHGLKLRNEV
jgi:hypothetical protein